MNVAVRVWTAERVEGRLTDALRIVVRNAGSIGPRAYANSMPESDPSFAELVWYGDKRREEEAQARIADILRRVEMFVSPAEMRMAEEALGWPAIFLADASLARDAIWTVTLGRSLNANVDKILARRRAAADAMIDRYKCDAGPDIIRIYEDDARDVATKWVARANAAMAVPLASDEVERLRQKRLYFLRRAAGPKNARKIRAIDVSLSAEEIAAALKRRNDRIKAGTAIQFRKEARRSGCVERIVQAAIRRQDVMPGRHFNLRHLYNAYHKALEMIAEGLSTGL